MKRLFKALLLSGIIFMSAIMGANVYAQQDESKMNLRGIWQFKQAEYMEKSSPLQPYQVKHVIKKEDDLYAYMSCFQDAVKRADFYNDDVLIIESLSQVYVGMYLFMTGQPESYKEQARMNFGGIGDIGKDAPNAGMKYNAPDILYLIEFIDENTICITLERICTENSVDTYGAVKCIMTRFQR